MSNVSVDPRILMTLQQSGANKEIVDLMLIATDNVDPAGLRQGVFMYDDDVADTEINIIDCVFKNDAGNAGKKGNIKLSVNLPDEEEFWYPYVTSNDPSAVPLECLEAEPSKDNKTLALTFREPLPNQNFLESLMFYTNKGPVDPGVSIRRGVGQ